MNRICPGCGCLLQNVDSKRCGYVPKEIIDDTVCERCFKITHYNEKLVLPVDNINPKLLDNINSQSYLTFFLVDFLHINSDVIDTFKKIKNDKVLVITKIDTLPKSITEEKMLRLLNVFYKIDERIVFLSTNSNVNVKSVFRIMDEKRVKCVLISGYTNAGKSTLINRLNMLMNKHSPITTSMIPNTTLDNIKIDIDEEHTLIDTPGFILDDLCYEFDDIVTLKKVENKKRIRPITLQVKKGNMVRVEKMYFVQNVQNSMTFYMSNALDVKKVYNVNEEFVEVNISSDSDVIVKGIGFINIKKACILKVSKAYENCIEIRKSIFME